MEQILLETLQRYMVNKAVISNNSHRKIFYRFYFTKGKLYLTNLEAFSGKIIVVTDERRSTDIIQLDWLIAFGTVPHIILVSKLERRVWWMDHLVGKELAEWTQSKSYDQWFNCKWRAVVSGIPLGSGLGPALFVTFASNMGSGIECTLSRLANDTNLYGGIDTLDSRDTIQRDLDRLESWAHLNLMMFSKAKCEVLHLNQGSPKNKYGLGGEWIEINPGEKDLRVFVDRRINIVQQ
ncbi:hypothetical protein DUI87_09412 [Hirundo rustica rustica]|uniref:Uncharacterized protein n=1 Tax=Hirundo rustica rustica TaxID=333673 RepID=A0A3M0KM29_HIRRU|nr:hypothetical protein DUI87_09412 [Hirundo rustica rustica]